MRQYLTLAERQQDRRIERYSALVDRKFGGNLTAAESEEMERLGEEIDQFFAPLYQPAIERLEAELQAMRVKRQLIDPKGRR